MSVDHAEIYAPEFGHQHLSNHFPMAAFALKKLGADADSIENLNKNNLKSLDLNSDSPNCLDIKENNFGRYLGKREAYSGYFAYFKNKVVIGKELPWIDNLAKGVSAGAFHALIRVGYGIDAHDASEMAAGLAYMADSFLMVVPEKNRSPHGSSQSVADFAQELVTRWLAGELEALPSKGVIFERMNLTAQDDARQKIISDAYNLNKLSLEQIAKTSLDIFLRTNNFTALHADTASHAARLVLPYVGDKEAFIRELFAGIVTAVLTIPSEEFKPIKFSSESPLSPEELLERGRACTDSHDIKFVYSCLEEYREYGDTRYLAAAELRLNGW